MEYRALQVQDSMAHQVDQVVREVIMVRHRKKMRMEQMVGTADLDPLDLVVVLAVGAEVHGRNMGVMLRVLEVQEGRAVLEQAAAAVEVRVMITITLMMVKMGLLEPGVRVANSAGLARLANRLQREKNSHKEHRVVPAAAALALVVPSS